MQSNILAPWAEVVPNAPYPFHVDDLFLLPDDTWTYEIVEGRLVRMPASGGQSSRIAATLLIELGSFVKAHKLGDVTGADGSYNLTQPGDTTETVLVPDMAFVRAGRLPSLMAPGAEKIPHLAPDLAVEVASPSQFHPEMHDKVRLFLARGVRMVWLIWPTDQKIEVWRPGQQTPIATLEIGDTLDGMDVIPGFTLPVADLFA